MILTPLLCIKTNDNIKYIFVFYMMDRREYKNCICISHTSYVDLSLFYN